MVDIRSGSILWRRTLTKRSYEGGVPFSLFGIIPNALRSSFHMRKERTIDLIERINRELVASMPDVGVPEDTNNLVFSVQVASFMDDSLAKNTCDQLKNLGLDPRIESALVGGMIWHRVIVGPFDSINEANKVKTKIEEASSYAPILIRRPGNRN
jgi:hypothetical protein